MPKPTARKAGRWVFCFGGDSSNSIDILEGGSDMSEYAHPEVLVSTQWVADHLSDPKVRLVEVDVDTTAYDQGHIPGGGGWNWQTQLQDNIRRDLIDKSTLEKLLRA